MMTIDDDRNLLPVDVRVYDDAHPITTTHLGAGHPCAVPPTSAADIDARCLKCGSCAWRCTAGLCMWGPPTQAALMRTGLVSPGGRVQAVPVGVYMPVNEDAPACGRWEMP